MHITDVEAGRTNPDEHVIGPISGFAMLPSCKTLDEPYLSWTMACIVVRSASDPGLDCAGMLWDSARTAVESCCTWFIRRSSAAALGAVIRGGTGRLRSERE